MIEDEELPRRKVWLTPLVLDTLGVSELRDYIAALQTEIGRAEAAIAARQDHRSAAESFFRKPG